MDRTEFARIRHKLGLSLSQMADALGIATVRNIGQMESGDRDVSGPIAKLMRIYDDGRVKPGEF